jgi:hypothetical protein
MAYSNILNEQLKAHWKSTSIKLSFDLAELGAALLAKAIVDSIQFAQQCGPSKAS